MNDTPQTELAKSLQFEVYQLRAENEELRKSLQQNQTMNDTPETQAAFLLFDTGEQGLHYVSEQMRRIERERDQLRQWTSANGVLELDRERDQYQAALARYLEAYRKEQVKKYELLCELQHMKASRNKWRICCEATIITLVLLTLLYFFE